MQTAPALVACLECDLLHRRTPLARGGEALCTRCGALLYQRRRRDANERALALTIAAMLLFVLANVFPIMSMEVQGLRSASTLFGAVRALWNEADHAIATLVAVTTMLVPAAELLGLAWVLACLRAGWRSAGALPLLHFLESVKPWGMVEVFVLGVLVSLVKLTHVASVQPGVALYAFGALMGMLAWAAASFDAEAAWQQLEQQR